MHIDKDLEIPPSETLLPVSATSCHGIKPRTAQPTFESRYLYFAYGSNLSPSQMRQRCIVNPDRSSKPLAVALLPEWRWLICEAGYANVLPPVGMRVGPQKSDVAGKVPVAGAEDAVYGVLYDMDPADETILDEYEGVDQEAEKADGSGEVGVDVRPREQGEGDYNKWYCPAQIVGWIDQGDHRMKVGKGQEVPTLVYVDEERVIMGPPRTEYIGRMNRAIRESEALGVPGKWLDEVLRRFIPKD